MCGLAGLFGEAPASHDDENLLATMLERLAHRGPDGRGIARSGRALLGSTRLSLIDLDHGHQPARGSATGLLLAYNGELYNHAATRARLTARGLRFEGRCDTEVLLRALEADGLACLAELEGMYAFAASDGTRLWLARDAFGIKPLYYALVQDGRRLVFASEVKALMAHPGVARRLDRTTLLEQAVFGFWLEQRTPWQAIRELPPGQVASVSVGNDGHLKIEFSTHSEPRAPGPAAETRPEDALLEGLDASVARQMLADHPVGAYLSGGLDSSVLVALATRHCAGPLHTLACAAHPDHPDLLAARAVATALGTQHHEHVPSTRDLLAAVAPSLVASESAVLPSIAELGAARLRRHVKAALCGDGADELFAGYPMHVDPGAWLRGRASRFNALVSTGAVRRDEAAASLACLRALHDDGLEPGLRTRVWRFALGSQLTNGHLRRWDLGTMAHGLELRVPYLDRDLRDLALHLPEDLRLRGSESKWLLRGVARRVLPASIVDLVVNRPKLAAPDAYGRGQGVVRRFLARLAPRDDPRRHPLWPYASHPAERVLLDLFVLAFAGWGGTLPADFQLNDLYRAHSEALASAYDRALT
jgi:asparagine synthase (glutamine-hydrolysing)